MYYEKALGNYLKQAAEISAKSAAAYIQTLLCSALTKEKIALRIGRYLKENNLIGELPEFIEQFRCRISAESSWKSIDNHLISQCIESVNGRDFVLHRNRFLIGLIPQLPFGLSEILAIDEWAEIRGILVMPRLLNIDLKINYENYLLKDLYCKYMDYHEGKYLFQQLTPRTAQRTIQNASGNTLTQRDFHHFAVNQTIKRNGIIKATKICGYSEERKLFNYV